MTEEDIMHKQMGGIRIEMNILSETLPAKKTLAIESTIREMKNTFDKLIISRLDAAGERIFELEDIKIVISQSAKGKHQLNYEKKKKKQKKYPRIAWIK